MKKERDHPRGEDCYQTALTEAKVRKIRSEYEQGGVSYSDLSRKYGTTKGNIYRIIKKQTWKHVG